MENICQLTGKSPACAAISMIQGRGKPGNWLFRCQYKKACNAQDILKQVWHMLAAAWHMPFIIGNVMFAG